MATLTDEEKAKLVLGDVESEADETTKEKEAESETLENSQEEEASENSEEETAVESEDKTPEAETQPSFTKQFTNLKGETPQEYITEIEKAYQNSTNEALRLKKQLDDSAQIIEEAKKVVATVPSATATEQPVAPTFTQDTNPDLAWAKQLREDAMITSFDEFKKNYPQAIEGEQFQKFLNASKGVEEAFKASHDNRLPTYPELYKGIADILGWQPTKVTAKRDAAIKESAASSQTVSATQPVAKQSKVTEAQVDAYLRMFPAKDRATVVKELSEAIS
jgi:hypothetical protein